MPERVDIAGKEAAAMYNNNNNYYYYCHDNFYGAVNTAKLLREFTLFI